jgi:sec-independent protein translocase protein TatA
MFSQIGPLELAIVLLIVLVIFGPKRLPGLGRQLGSGMREFKDAVTGGKGKDDDDDEPDAFGRTAREQTRAREALPAATATATAHAEDPASEPAPPVGG